MSDTEKTGAEAEEKTEAKTPVASPKFTIERLRKDCLTLFGVTVSTYDGATHGMTGEHTVEEMKKHIATWQGKQVVPTQQTKKEGK